MTSSLRNAWSILLIALILSVTVSSAPLSYPMEISSASSNWAATISVQVYTVVVPGAVTFNTRAYCYNGVCSHPGPTIRLKPGDIFNLTLVNNLSADSNNYTMNFLHSPNTTNLHTHGLHIDPNVDSVFVRVNGGQNYTYNYVVPQNHAPGFHWYHAHSHGSSTFQVMGGLVGALFVSPANASAMPSSITGMTAHPLVLTYVKFNQSVVNGSISQGCGFNSPCSTYQGCTSTATAPFNPFRVYSYYELSNEIFNLVTPNVTLTSNSTSEFYFVNGQFKPSLTMAPGEYRILQIVNAVGSYAVQVSFEGAGGCTMDVIAIDGIYVTALQRKTVANFLQATRMEIMVMCPSAGTYSLTGIFGDSTRVRQTLLTLSVVGATNATAAVTDNDLVTVAALRPSYLKNLTSSAFINSTYELEFSQGGRDASQCFFWLGGGTNCTNVWTGSNPSATDATCPFQSYGGQRGSSASSKYKFVTNVGAINEWSVYGLGADAHPFHLHVNHMQIISFTPTPGTTNTDNYQDYFQLGEWRDTVPALDGKLVVRFIAADLPGETILHCHFLRHEDLGMMDSIYICDPKAQTCPSSYLVSAGSSSLLTTVSASSTSSSASSTRAAQSSTTPIKTSVTPPVSSTTPAPSSANTNGPPTSPPAPPVSPTRTSTPGLGSSLGWTTTPIVGQSSTTLPASSTVGSTMTTFTSAMGSSSSAPTDTSTSSTSTAKTVSSSGFTLYTGVKLFATILATLVFVLTVMNALY